MNTDFNHFSTVITRNVFRFFGPPWILSSILSQFCQHFYLLGRSLKVRRTFYLIILSFLFCHPNTNLPDRRAAPSQKYIKGCVPCLAQKMVQTPLAYPSSKFYVGQKVRNLALIFDLGRLVSKHSKTAENRTWISRALMNILSNFGVLHSTHLLEPFVHPRPRKGAGFSPITHPCNALPGSVEIWYACW